MYFSYLYNHKEIDYLYIHSVICHILLMSTFVQIFCSDKTDLN